MQTHLPASQKILFISDVHLGAFSEQNNQALENELIALLDFARDNNFAIALLGDLFDYWIEYPGFVPSLGERLLKRFKKYHTSGQKTLYITGNHDNWTLGYFEKSGFDVEPDHRILHINKKKILLLHGDAIGADLDHLQRPAIHRVLRNQLFLKIYRTLLSPGYGLKLMRLVSKFSRWTEPAEKETEKLDHWSKSMLQKSDIDYIICGHDHVPRCIKYSFGTYLNLGTFYTHKSMVMYNNHTFKLVTWNSNDQALNLLKPQNTGNEQF